MNLRQTDQANKCSGHRPKQPTARRCVHGVLAIIVALGASASDIDKANGQPCTTPPPGMVAWWPLDELAGPTAAETVNNNDGTHINGPVPLAGAFVLNSLCFDGLTNYVQVPNAPDLNFGTGDLSIDAWIQTTGTNSVRVIVEKRGNPATGVVGYSMYLYQGNLGFRREQCFPSPPNWSAAVSHGTGTSRESATSVEDRRSWRCFPTSG